MRYGHIIIPLMLFICVRLYGQTVPFNNDWKFFLSNTIEASAPNYDDSQWRTLSLPHDWSIEPLSRQDKWHVGPFTKGVKDSTSTGHATGGAGWYRKHFITESWMKNKNIEIEFDGVMERSTVWINGHHLGFHPNGYMPFNYDMTSFINPVGQENVVAVYVLNPGDNSRWYTGSGIYRKVRISAYGKIYVSKRDLKITTNEVSSQRAMIKISFPIINANNKRQRIKASVSVSDFQGNIVYKKEIEQLIYADGKYEVNMPINIENPFLWSPDTPSLYSCLVSLFHKGKEVYSHKQSFGIRTLDFSVDNGFLLNGKSVILKGACVHHDNGLLGSAAYNRAEIRKVRLLKNAGFNAVRTSHNPPSEDFLNACDTIGLLVIDEAFDMWKHPKREQDYHLYFDEYSERDLASMIRRDRNHPCVIIWSIGNEIYERADSSGMVIARSLISTINKLDSTRPITQAICDFWDNKNWVWEDTYKAYELLDIGSYNYDWWRYTKDHELFPHRIMMGTESFSREMFENWKEACDKPYVIGDFVWTGIDYIGEVGIGNAVYTTSVPSEHNFAKPERLWPWFLSGCGEIDICGYPKAPLYYRNVIWGNSKLEILVHEPIPESKKELISKWGWPKEYPYWDWNGEEGKTLHVRVFSTGDSVRLLLNHREIATKAVDDKLMSLFDVIYSPGELTAEAIAKDSVLCRKTLKTAEAAVRLRLIADKKTIDMKSDDLIFVQVEVVDANNNIVINNCSGCHVSIEGAGKLIASSNAAPDDMNNFIDPHKMKLYQGKGLVVISPDSSLGSSIVLCVTAEGLPAEKIKIMSLVK